MIKREEVYGILRRAEDRIAEGVYNTSNSPAVLISELARTWLRVNDAPVGEISEAGFNEDLRGFVQLMASDWTVADVPIGQRVRLVPEADSGGEG